MKRLILIALFISSYFALSSTAYSQIVVKEFKDVNNQTKVEVQNVTAVQTRANIPFVADITKLQRTMDLSPEERKAFDENFQPDTLYIRELKLKDQALFPKSTLQKSIKSDAPSFDLLYFKRWSSIEKGDE